MLGTRNDKEKNHWHDFAKPLVHAYNCTRHETTGFTPHGLMFGRQPWLPVDLAFNVPLNDSIQQSHSQSMQSLKTHQIETSNNFTNMPLTLL